MSKLTFIMATLLLFHDTLTQNLRININRVLPSVTLYLLPKIQTSASDGKSGVGVYACDGQGFTGNCNWHRITGSNDNNDWKQDIGKCFQIGDSLGSLGPDEGVYCAAFHTVNDCKFYSGEQRSPVPGMTSISVAATYPGVSNVTDQGFVGGGGVWAYCFRGDSINNHCLSAWGTWCP
ncbi:hypothetical protein BT63DRAFT_417759 [Microthyrium microscopicum]|uniref:Uncharacterized protein n=1 Tax=Microthyrium microscopicum TaxID=703497 RepID=A0A6A6TYU9_9PEZI|nr:hypothetical protein BT63DRAFT_417759 [Microthyrium microscopicum]